MIFAILYFRLVMFIEVPYGFPFKFGRIAIWERIRLNLMGSLEFLSESCGFSFEIRNIKSCPGILIIVGVSVVKW